MDAAVFGGVDIARDSPRQARKKKACHQCRLSSPGRTTAPSPFAFGVLACVCCVCLPRYNVTHVMHCIVSLPVLLL
jgi:hypothetical protein